MTTIHRSVNDNNLMTAIQPGTTFKVSAKCDDNQAIIANSLTLSFKITVKTAAGVLGPNEKIAIDSQAGVSTFFKACNTSIGPKGYLGTKPFEILTDLPLMTKANNAIAFSHNTQAFSLTSTNALQTSVDQYAVEMLKGDLSFSTANPPVSSQTGIFKCSYKPLIGVNRSISDITDIGHISLMFTLNDNLTPFWTTDGANFPAGLQWSIQDIFLYYQTRPLAKDEKPKAVPIIKVFEGTRESVVSGGLNISTMCIGNTISITHLFREQDKPSKYNALSLDQIPDVKSLSFLMNGSSLGTSLKYTLLNSEEYLYNFIKSMAPSLTESNVIYDTNSFGLGVHLGMPVPIGTTINTICSVGPGSQARGTPYSLQTYSFYTAIDEI